jgi:acetyl-CoA synthetase
VRKGDRVAIYLPMIPEAAIAMLACARIGAIHSVIFAGFSADSLVDRITDMKSSLVITADGGWRRGSVVALKHEVDAALGRCPSVKNVIVVKRPLGEPFPCKITEGRDHWYHRLMEDSSPVCPAAELDSEDMLYILYTSGTTGKPKGIVHTTGGYAVQTRYTMRAVFDLKDDDVFLVHRRRGLGHGTQLRRVWSAARRARPCSCTKAHRISRRRIASGPSSRSMAFRFSTPRRPRSARS